MKKLLFVLTFFVLTNAVKAQTPNSSQLGTFDTYPLKIQVLEPGTLKELAFLEMDTTKTTYTKRGSLNIAIWHIGRFMASYTQQYLDEKAKVGVLKGISDNINDDGTVKDWPKLSSWLDKAKAMGLR